jgi:hypothetical protein
MTILPSLELMCKIARVSFFQVDGQNSVEGTTTGENGETKNLPLKTMSKKCNLQFGWKLCRM